MNNFIYPNCLSNKILNEKFVSINKPNTNPWSSITQIMKCKKCKKDIPAHLGERWDNISIEKAKEEYRKYYFNTDN